jgi:preprotein translocase subunit SecA
MFQKIVRVIGGDPNKKQILAYTSIVDEINALEESFETYTDEQLHANTDEFRLRLAQGESLDDLLPEAFATVREVSKRTLGQRHYDVQIIGGITLHNGIIAEMRTGEGKTLAATLPIYLNALALNPEWVVRAKKVFGEQPEDWKFDPLDGIPVGQGTHLITVNDYLARRDARWMGSIYTALGLTVGVLQMAARTENGKKAFIVDYTRESPHEDQHQMRMVPRREAYAADITYGTNSEFGFDYLRDNMTMRLSDRVQRGHRYAIIDEVDNVLIDEARTPLIISGPAHDDTEWYLRMAQVVKSLNPEDYEVAERDRTVTLTEIGETHVEALLDQPLRDPERPEDITPEQARLMGYLEQALRAQYLYHRNKEYIVQAGKVIIVDEFTGRMMPGRRWSDGLHQAVEAKEGVRVQRENVTYATITIQNYFRMYDKLAGMTGTAVTEAEEFDNIYKLGVLAIPTNLDYQAQREDTSLIILEDRDRHGYRYEYYTEQDDPHKTPIFWKRKDYPDIVYRSEEAKMRAIVREVLHYHVQGRPILLGTTSVELSEHLSNRLRAENVQRLARVLMLRDAWMTQHDRVEDGRQIEALEFLNQSLDQLNISEMRKLARDLNISFNPGSPENLERLLQILDLLEGDPNRLDDCLKAGVPHQVLNARKHTEESQIIAGAGSFGAVTIATNMAGRGVDIKLGGELAEEIHAAVTRVLRRIGYEEPYNMSLEERRLALLDSDEADYGIRESEIHYFLKYMEEMERVRDLGGLHVIGSERHESRRIDNQLRGRSARQGDPGSSRFYLSMEDELMRLFGGQQAEGLMQRMKIDEAMPLEIGLVGRIIEQSQTRVEGANFDVRKHLLEYDDVLNTQRAKIYSQRDRIFTKDDLTDDVTEMLQTEVLHRVPTALEDDEGPWKLLAWLDQIQPNIIFNNIIYPSYSLRLLLQDLGATSLSPAPETDGGARLDRDTALAGLVEIARRSLDTEEQHVLHATTNLADLTRDRMESQLAERLETIETYFEGFTMDDELEERNPRQVQDELSSLTHLPIRLTQSELSALYDDPDRALDSVVAQVEQSMYQQATTRLIGAVERRLEEPLGLDKDELASMEWNTITDQVLDAIQDLFSQRRQRLIGQNGEGQINKDLNASLPKSAGKLNDGQIANSLIQMRQGARATFDKRTHRRVWQRTSRLNYVYAAARILEDRDPEEITSEVSRHLEGAQMAMRFAWGQAEWQRLANTIPSDLDEGISQGLREALEDNQYVAIQNQPLGNLQGELRAKVINELGRQALTEVYRQLLLSVISELWVEYLTSMEALRVSIGLEAYAQRDPLVQYKNKAFGMFQELLDNMRLAVVNRMFTFRPRQLDLSSTPQLRSRRAEIEGESAVIETEVQADEPTESLVTSPEPTAISAEVKPQTRSHVEDQQTSTSQKRRRRRKKS